MVVEKVEARDRDLVDVWATIYVERSSQKGIVIGRAVPCLRSGEVGPAGYRSFARSQVNLQLWVKVKDDWREKAGTLSDFGYSLSLER